MPVYPLISTIYPLISTTYPLISTIYPLISTIYPLISTIYPLISTIYPLISTIYPLISTIDIQTDLLTAVTKNPLSSQAEQIQTQHLFTHPNMALECPHLYICLSKIIYTPKYVTRLRFFLYGLPNSITCSFVGHLN